MCRGNRKSWAGALLALASVTAVLLAACGQQYSAPASTTTSSTRAPSLAEIAAAENGSSNGRAPVTTQAPLENPEDAIIPLPEPEPEPAPTVAPETTTPPTLVDRDKLEEQLPDIGLVQACFQAQAGYALMHALSLNGASGAAEAASTANQIKIILPPSLYDDMDVVSAAIASAATDGSFEPDPKSKPGYPAANAALSAFFERGCVG
jgi:hypothetical protein